MLKLLNANPKTAVLQEKLQDPDEGHGLKYAALNIDSARQPVFPEPQQKAHTAEHHVHLALHLRTDLRGDQVVGALDAALQQRMLLSTEGQRALGHRAIANSCHGCHDRRKGMVRVKLGSSMQLVDDFGDKFVLRKRFTRRGRLICAHCSTLHRCSVVEMADRSAAGVAVRGHDSSHGLSISKFECESEVDDMASLTFRPPMSRH